MYVRRASGTASITDGCLGTECFLLLIPYGGRHVCMYVPSTTETASIYTLNAHAVRAWYTSRSMPKNAQDVVGMHYEVGSPADTEKLLYRDGS